MSVAGTELPTSALQRFRAELKGQLTFGGRDGEDRSWYEADDIVAELFRQLCEVFLTQRAEARRRAPRHVELSWGSILGSV